MTTAAAPARPAVRVHRFEVTPRPGLADPLASAVQRDAQAAGLPVSAVRTAHVYLVRAALDDAQLRAVSARLLADPVTESVTLGSAPAASGSHTVEIHPLPGVMDPVAQSVELAIRELLAGDSGAVASPVAAQVSTGWRYDLSGISREQADTLAKRVLANPVIQRVETKPWHPADFAHAAPHDQAVRSIPIINLSDAELEKLSRDAHLFLSLDEMKAIQTEYRSLGRDPRDIELETLAQTWSEHCVHKTLKSTVRYTGHEVTQAQRHEGAAVDPIKWEGRPGHVVNPDGSVTINNLLKSTVAAATFELIADGVDWTLSVFKDNSGVIALDEQWGVCIKVETHNHPSAIEPYGGAATGAGGCIRDVIGTGLGARPIANTDVFCVANSDMPADLVPPGCLHPRRVLTQVVAGVRDYGNRMGIPTVNGAVYFDDRYIGNPLVYCGCIGLIPRHLVKGQVQPGDRIIALGGRTGRDGIHGATFSSAELTDTHADEFSHAVQIGNAITEKQVLDAIMRARDGDGVDPKAMELLRPHGVRRARWLCGGTISPPGLTDFYGTDDGRVFAVIYSVDTDHLPAGTPSHRAIECGEPERAFLEKTAAYQDWLAKGIVTKPLYSAMTDCGAGGFSSAIGEMGSQLGAEVHLERAPLKYPGLSYTEIWISEAQERMVLAVPAANVPALQKICDEEGVEMADLGHFGTPTRDLILNYRGTEVGRLSTHFLHEGIPMPTREAVWKRSGQVAKWPSGQVQATPASNSTTQPLDHSTTLAALLRHPNIASKHWIIRQYDHEVRGSTVIKPLVGPGGRGPGDAAVLEPIPGSDRGIAIGCGLQTGMGDPLLGGDPYLMTLAAIDECVRNLVCVGADPSRIAILDNFCWPSCKKPENLASLVRAAEGCYDGAKAYRTPFVSGKDSLNNQFTLADGRTIEIPPTLLITGLGIVPRLDRCTTSDAKEPGNVLILVGETGTEMGGSHLQQLLQAGDEAALGRISGSSPSHAGVGACSEAGASGSRSPNPSGDSLRGLRSSPACTASTLNPAIPTTDLSAGPATARAVAALIASGLVRSAHDLSDGGLAVAIAEMLIGSASSGGGTASAAQPRIGAEINLGTLPWKHNTPGDTAAALFAETPSRYLLEIRPQDIPAAHEFIKHIPHAPIGRLNTSGTLSIPIAHIATPVEDLAAAWRGTLDW